MTANQPIRAALAALALLAASSCAVEADAPATPSDPVDPLGPATTDILVEVVRPDGAPIVAADVAVQLTDGTWIQAVTDGGGRLWVEAPPDRIASIVAVKEASSFEAVAGAVVYATVAKGEPVTLVLERDDPFGGLSIRGELVGLVDPDDAVMITATADARVTRRGVAETFSMLLPDPEPFVLLGVEWRRGPLSSTRVVHRDLVAFAHADSGGPATDGMWLELDFGNPPEVAWEPGTDMPWTRRAISGTFTAPGDAALADRGRADVSLHFVGTEGTGYLGGATLTEPTADGYRYDVLYEAPLVGAVETLITVEAEGAESGAWLAGPPPEGLLELDFLSPADVVLSGEDIHEAITWALRPEEDHDRTVLYFRRDGKLLGRMIAPAYLRWATLPVMPTLQAESELMDGPLELVVETCATNPLHDRCERFARSAPTTVVACPLPFCCEP